ncbi:MAG: hypothetical protein GY854_33605 [Deltaproteobacteria bacterium]|nr:hypothetical protein [Deltaproteobacteria bacterium]
MISKLPADYKHLIIDACYAEGIVGAKGLFGRETDGRQIPVTNEDMAHISEEIVDANVPSLGVFISSSGNKEAYEWSQIESGVFAIAGGLAVTSIVLGAVSLNARSEYEATSLQRDSHEADDKYQRFGNAAWITAAAVPVVVVGGIAFKATRAQESAPYCH